MRQPAAPGRPTSTPPGPAPTRLIAGILLAGFALTVTMSWSADRIDDATEQRLLQIQTEQAATVLSAAIAAIQAPLRVALEVDRLGGGTPASLRAAADILETSVGPEATFVAASVSRVPPLARGDDASTRGGPRAAGAEVIELGAGTLLGAGTSRGERWIAAAARSGETVTRRVRAGDRVHIVYIVASRSTGLAVYAERPIPADRRAPVDRDSAYFGLHYAIYLGEQTLTPAMTTTNVDPASLPLEGETTHTTVVPFGDQVLTLVTTPRDHLGSDLSRRLPAILLVTGVLCTILAAGIAGRLSQARSRAEADTSTIRALYEQVDALYTDQRQLFVALQRALLPQADPGIPNVEVAAEYVAGAIGIDIGGDWYSVINIDEDHFAFVVGDVSGRGVEAVAEMARARFTLRAYLVEGHRPAQALTRCAAQFDISQDGHIVTALVGVGNHRTGEITLANAGHPPPLLATDGRVEVVTTEVGPPLGLGGADYEQVTFTLPPAATLICYTDGLIERRTEDIDTGLRRLVDTVTPAAHLGLAELVDHTLSVMHDSDAPDDTAILALRRH